MSNSEDRSIQETDNDATDGKAFAVKIGYWKDAYIRFFSFEPKRKAPEINRGYFARTQAIEAMVIRFIKIYPECQVVSIGAGSDTIYFRLLDAGYQFIKFVELDLQENVVKKINVYQMRKAICDKLQAKNLNSSRFEICQDPYYLLTIDARRPPNLVLDELIKQTNLDLSVPTLLLSECVFVYIDTEIVNNLIHQFSEKFTTSVFLSYDLVNMEDTFGKVMLQNMKLRGINFHGVSACQDAESQKRRYTKAGYAQVNVWTISQVYRAFSKETLKRIESLEMLDDPEMMQQLLDHYCIIVASKNTDGSNDNFQNLSELLSSVK